jgi:acyl-CoA hydrolase
LAGDYPELAYDAPLQSGHLPPNISVYEFYFPAGRRLNAPLAQQSYTSTNYTHAARDLLDRGVNVIAQLVARRSTGEDSKLSLSCNPDITLDLLPELRLRRNKGEAIAIAGQINKQLPFMLGPAVVDPSEFDFILDGPFSQFDLFAIPKQPVSLTDYATAFHVATLIEDGGTLQIGIGGFADALTHALRLRQQHNNQFRTIVKRLGSASHDESIGGLGIFKEGLYGCSEMLGEGLLELKRIGVVKRRALQRSQANEDVAGPIIHAAFFLGSKALYEQLRNLNDDEIADIAMTSVSFVNQLYGDETIKRANRKKARFINRAIMATALGAIVSDGLENGQIISGVGGQYNFVAQAHELTGARSIIVLDSVRVAQGKTTSNIVWNYGHTTIPRHLRDIVVTEYGVADLRGKSDRDVIAAMLNVTDSRFQSALLDTAKRAGKMEKTFKLPGASRNNFPDRIANALSDAQLQGWLPEYPLGTEMTATEIRLVRALKSLRSIAHSRPKLLSYALGGGLGPAPSPAEQACLERLQLQAPKNSSEQLMRWSVLRGLRDTQTTF